MIQTAQRYDAKQILNMDVTKMIKEFTKGNLSSEKVTNIYIEHLQHVNPHIQFLTENRFSLALKEAKKADHSIQKGQVKGRLFGVPISIKESFHMKGMRTTGGLIHRRNNIENKDAEVIRLLKKEGAIIIGRTNTPALSFCQETVNKLYGKTNNPWHIERTAGGSTGGEGALIAVGGAAAGLGSDIGGSIRFPSHFNGIVGFKSGANQVVAEGSYPNITDQLQKRMLGIGPMVKSVRDARLIYQIIANKPTQSTCSLDDFMMSFLPEGLYPLTDETEQLIQHISNEMKKSYHVEAIIPPFFQDSALIWQEIMAIDGGKSIAQSANLHSHLSVGKQFIKEKLTRRSDYHHYLTWALIGARLFKPSQKRVRQIEAIIKQGDDRLNEFLSKRILVIPVYHRSAPPHGHLYREIFSVKKTFKKYMPYVAYANVWGLPSLTIPVGVDQHNMPIAIQLISKVGNEEALFRLGQWIEIKFQGYQRCTLHDKEKYASISHT